MAVPAKKVVTEDPALIEARAAITQAVKDAVHHEAQGGKAYARAIRAVLAGIDAGLSRREIAVAVRLASPISSKAFKVEHLDGKTEVLEKTTKGTAARYVALARWERAIKANEGWIKGETPLEGPVKIGPRTYKSPIAALDSGVVSFRQVYLAFRDNIRPNLVSYKALPQSAAESAERAIESLAVPIVTGSVGSEKRERVKVTENPEAFAGVLQALLTSPLGMKLTTAKSRSTMLGQLSALLVKKGKRKALETATG